MSESTNEQPTPHIPTQPVSPSEADIVPLVIYGPGIDPDVLVEPQEAAQTFRDLGISEEGIGSSTVYMDPKNRFLNLGTHYSNRLGRRRFHNVPELQDVKGDIIRLSTKVRGKPRTAAEINHTFVHEGEHHAQLERHDRKLIEGHVAIWGLALAGAVIGTRLGQNLAGDIAMTAAGGYVGHSVGYLLAPHERQARKRAREVTSKAVTRKSKP